MRVFEPESRLEGYGGLKDDDLWIWLLAGAGAIVALGFIFGEKVEDIVITATRTPQDILDVVASVNPAGNPDLQPGANGGADWCNKALYLMLSQLGVELPANIVANDEIAYMSSGADGWSATDAAGAINAAMQGQIGVATYYNPGSHGHVALVLPIDNGTGIPQIAQAGAQTFNQGSVLQGFGALPVAYYAHA